MITLTPERWQEISPHLDHGLSLPEAERRAWLQDLQAQKPELAGLLQELMAEHSALGKDDFLNLSYPELLNESTLAGQTLGPYTLISRIGQGGMGSVWMAQRTDGRFERRVAVKFLNFSLGSHGGMERFRREGMILGQLAHPHIAELIDAGVTATGGSYLVLEYIEGNQIDEYCDEHHLSVEARIAIFLDVLSAVAHAHANLIVHRDIKPANVLVSSEGQVKLLDFGIAKLLADHTTPAVTTMLTMEGGGPLTPLFAAPEQVSGGAVTTATDVYALGVLLYILLSGRHPAGVGPHSPANLMKAIVETEPRRPSETAVSESSKLLAEKRDTNPEKLGRQLRGELDAIVLKALQKDPRQRYASADSFAVDLKRYLAGEPVSAQPESSWYHARKFLFRHRWLVTSVASVIVALALGLSAALWQAHVARRETRVANAVDQFLQDIFNANSSSQSDPVKARQTTARELLDIGSRKIDTELTDVPEAKLDILNTLGRMYVDLGLDDQAVEMQRKRVALARTKFGKDSSELAASLIDLGGALHASHSVNEGDAVLLEAKGILDRRRDFTSMRRGTLLQMLAQQTENSDLQRSLDYSRQAVEIYRRYPGEPDLGEALYLEGVDLYTLGQQRQAEPVFQEALQTSIRLSGDPNPSLPRFYAYLGQAQQELMEFASAEDSFRRAAQTALKMNGEDHVDTLETELRLGLFLSASSRTWDGLEHLGHARDILLRTRGEADPFYAPQVFLEYGWALVSVGRLEDGLAYISKAVENRRKNRPGTRYLGQMLEKQAWVLTELGHYDEAQRLQDEASKILTQTHAGVSYLAVDGKARWLTAQGRLGEAETVLNGYHPGASPADTLPLEAMKLQVSTSEVALARTDADTAFTLASRVNSQVTSSSARIYLAWLEARSALVAGKAELLRGHPSQALPLLQRAVEIREKLMDPMSPPLALAEVALAQCYAELGDLQQARKFVDRGKKALAAHRQLGDQYTRPLHAAEEQVRRAGAQHS